MKVYARGGVVRFHRSDLTDADHDEDRRLLSCEDPDYRNAVRQGAWNAREMDRTISSLTLNGEWVEYPAGAPEVYRRRLRLRQYTLVDERPTFTPEPIPCSTVLEPFQCEMLEALAARPNGVGVAGCGSGKTEVGVALTARLGLPTLILVGQLDIAEGWRACIRRRLEIEPGMIGAGEFDVRRITIALVQGLTDERLALIADKFGVVIRDEVHHAASEGDRRILRALMARRFYGLTATDMRADGLWPFVLHHFGPVAYRVTAEQLAHRRVDPEIVFLLSRFVFNYVHRNQWADLLKAVMNDEARNRLIVDTAEREARDGELVAVLIGQVEHGRALNSECLDRGLRSVLLTGRTPKRERAELLEGLRNGAYDVVVGTSLLDEGVDIVPLSRVILAWPGRAEARLIQRVGRALRCLPGKSKPRIYDVVDERVGVLRAQARARRAVLDRLWPSTPALTSRCA